MLERDDFRVSAMRKNPDELFLSKICVQAAEQNENIADKYQRNMLLQGGKDLLTREQQAGDCEKLDK